MFERRVNGKFGWYKGGDEKKDWKYVGEIKNGKPNGHGTLTKPEGSKYVGKFNDGKYHGQGTMISTDGTKWVGDFRGNKPWNLSLFDKK